MTDGIIQKVFEKYFNEESPNLCDIQQELIADIKEICNRDYESADTKIKTIINRLDMYMLYKEV